VVLRKEPVGSKAGSKIPGEKFAKAKLGKNLKYFKVVGVFSASTKFDVSNNLDTVSS